ncbi:GlsB/YeaQ/YmgE family stress response membrane protein [Glacieibacterium frigidum]|uniref:GlsB/YeaQ/YmgE family stress response membrane protein n=1 Tax=Glacieibacterium frigidum TaxID=2593303 RepID=A0A552UIR6_9SPHN|nr:GlsB/YeaQ/YmgE family stress response membrane protein [Glacieibacterium frigidum]TRW18097.1 GlsB/YeaQ/YmgE family stress response membrane protein [Glacieibacterium frigidum]
MLSLLWAAIIGLIAGAIAKFIMPGRDPGGIFVTMLIGVAGALLMSFIGRQLGWYADGEGAGFIMAIVGAIILLALYRLINKNRTV